MIKQLQKPKQPQIQHINLLDTEYAAIVAASRNADGEALFNPTFLVKDIVRYRNSTKHSVKDILLYRLGECLGIFSAQDREMIEQCNWRLNDEQRQRVIQLLFERFGVTL